MADPSEIAVSLHSSSQAADLGYRALADLATATVGISDYRVVGGHMVALLLHAYPTPTATLRATADADAGIDMEVAATQHLHRRLVAIGYTSQPEHGNRYIRSTDHGHATIDVLLPWGIPGTPTMVAGRAFDQIPGLSLALSSAPLLMHVQTRLTTNDALKFAVLVPDIEGAVVLKTLAWKARTLDKDLADLNTLFEIVEAHPPIAWRLNDARSASIGTRKDTVQALRLLLTLLDTHTNRRRVSVPSPARLGALIRKHIGF